MKRHRTTARVVPALSVAPVLLAATGAAQAEEHTGFEVHGALGSSLMRDEDDSGTFDGDAFGYCVGLEYRFVPRFALGLDYFDLGSATDTVASTEMEVEASGFDLYARLVLPLSETVEAFGRLGRVHYYADVINDFEGFDPFGDDGISIGGGLDIGRDAFAFRLEGRYIDGGDEESGALLSAGFSYRF